MGLMLIITFTEHGRRPARSKKKVLNEKLGCLAHQNQGLS